MGAALQGRRIVVPETRELDLLARMIAAEGGEAVRCPLVAIVDAPDPAPVREWLYRFRDVPCDDVILLSGEGLRRRHSGARKGRLAGDWRRGLATGRTITGGPKGGQGRPRLEL